MYSLRLKMIVIIFGFFGSKMIIQLSARIEIEAQSQIFSHQTFYVKKSFDTATSGGISE